MVTGWYVDDLNNKYYYLASGKAATGLTKVDGVQYYFNSYGRINRNTTINDSANKRVIKVDDNGVATVYTLKENGLTNHAIYGILRQG